MMNCGFRIADCVRTQGVSGRLAEVLVADGLKSLKSAIDDRKFQEA